MPKEALREERSWPSTRKFTEMQTFLAHTTVARNPRLCFVVPVERTCPNVDENGVDREVIGEGWIDLHEAIDTVERWDNENREE